MTGQERDFEEILSRVLHSATDQIEPVGDGLTKIRGRLTEPWLKRQLWLLRSELAVLGWLVVVRCESFLATVRAGSGGTAGESPAQLNAGTGPEAGAAESVADHGGRLRWLQPVLGPVTASAAAKRLGKASGPLRRSVGPAMAWLRPALAVAGAVVLVVAGVFALGPMRGAFLGLENATGTGTSTSGNDGGSGHGNPNGGGAPAPGSKAGAPTRGRSGAAKGGATSRSKATPSPSSCSSPSTPPINSPSPTPTPTISPTPTPTISPTPTATPTATSTNGPMSSPMVAGTHNWSIRTTALVVCAPSAPASPTNQATSGA
jgi:hypothetical protein